MLDLLVQYMKLVKKYFNIINMEKFIKDFAEILDVENKEVLTPETKFTELDEWSSFAAVQLIVMFDENYGKAITAEDLRNCSTISDLFKMSN